MTTGFVLEVLEHGEWTIINSGSTPEDRERLQLFANTENIRDVSRIYRVRDREPGDGE